MTGQTDHAVVITGYERAELLAEPRDPTPLAPDEVAGATLATLISAGTELAGSYRGAEFPRRPGYAAVFRVEEVGEAVADLDAGDLVLCMGRHQSYQRHPRARVVPVPQGLSPEEATFARLMGVSMSTLTTTTARPPERVMVTGLGLVGHLAAQIFRSCSYRVLGVDPSEARRDLAQERGIADLAPAVPVDDPQVVDHVALALECSGHEGAALDACRVVRKRGEVVLVGAPWERRTERYAHEFTHLIFHRYVVVRSGWEWEVPLFPTDFCTNSIYGNLAAALAWLAEGRVRVEGLYMRVAPREAQQAYQDLLHMRVPRLGVVLDWTTLGG